MKKIKLVFILFSVIIFASGCFSNNEQRITVIEYLMQETFDSSGEYDYCVEWNKTIQRQSIDSDCLLASKPTLNCDYEIKKDNSLEVTIYNHSAEIENMVVVQRSFDCSRLVKSITI